MIRNKKFKKKKSEKNNQIINKELMPLTSINPYFIIIQLKTKNNII